MQQSTINQTTEHHDSLMDEFDGEISEYTSYETTAHVSMETHLPETNIGYKLLQKMGWRAGKGLGPTGQGRIDPIRIELKDDALGVGKAQELNTNHIESTSKRKALDSEKQLEESETQKLEREYRAEKKQAIEKELQEVKRAFYCELCDKQYKKVSEYDQHLQSYDHHHKKRFKDMKETTRNSTANQSEREKKLARERKREEKELKRMQEAIQKKIAGTNPQISKPIVPSVKQVATYAVSAPVATSNGSTGSSNGGWSSGGWSMSVPKVNTDQETKTNTEQLPKVETKEIQRENTSKPTNTVESVNPAPKKLAFGLKKSGFQFGLKKK